MKKTLSLPAKLLWSFLGISLVPLVVMTLITTQASKRNNDGVGNSYLSTAEQMLDKIDRNLFERYGDVQAFGLNKAVLETSRGAKSARSRTRLSPR